MAARCCWSISSRATAPPRWSSAHARGGHERQHSAGDGFAAGGMVAVAAKPRILDDGCGCFCGDHGAGAAVVDDPGLGVCTVVARVGGVDRQLSRLGEFTE